MPVAILQFKPPSSSIWLELALVNLLARKFDSSHTLLPLFDLLDVALAAHPVRDVTVPKTTAAVNHALTRHTLKRSAIPSFLLVLRSDGVDGS